MPTLRSLVRPWQARQHAFASMLLSRLLSLNACRLDAQGRSCHAHLTSGESSVLRSASDAQDVDRHVMHSAPGNDGFALKPCAMRPLELQACKHHVKVPKLQACKHHALSSHIYTSASKDGSLDDCSAPMMHTRMLETFGSRVPQNLKPCVQPNALKRCHDAVLHTDESALTPTSKTKDTKCFKALRPSQTPHISMRSKGKQKSQRAAALHQKLALLESENVSLCGATIVGRLRAFKCTSVEHLAAVLKVLKETLGSSENAAQALAANKGLLSQPIELLEQKLKVMADFGITEVVVRKLLTCKHSLPLKVESLQEKLSFFKENGVDAESLNKLLNGHPSILRRCPEGSFVPVMNFLRSLGMRPKQFPLSMWRHPSLLSVSLDNLREKYELFQQLGFSGNKYTKTLLPPYSIEKLQASTDLLKDQGFSDSDVHKMILRQPAILGVNLETLKSKLEFLLCKQKYGPADIMKWPVCLLYSLQGRLIPRIKVLEENGLSKVYSLSTILGCNELKFQELGKRKRK